MTSNNDHQTHQNSSEKGGGSLRMRLNEMTSRLAAFEEVVAAEAWRKRNADDKKFQLIADLAVDMESLLTDEVKQRMESLKFLEQLSAKMIDEASQKLTDIITENVARQAGLLEKLVSQCEKLESHIEPLHKSITDSTEHNDLAVVQDSIYQIAENIKSLENKCQSRIFSQIDESHRKCMSKLRDLKKNVHDQIEEDTLYFKMMLDNIRKQKIVMEREAIDSNAMYQSYVPEELEAFKSAITHESAAREDTDDALVKALNEYNTALHKGFSTVIKG